MKTVVGLFDELSDAQNVVEDLVTSGFDQKDISLVANDSSKTYSSSIESNGEGDKMAEGAMSGAVTGGAIGGIGGVLLGLGLLAIPGIGPVVAAGPIIAGLTGAGIGAAVGGLVGALVNWGIPEEEAEYYAEGVRRGGTLVGVRVDDSRVEEVVDIMNEYGPVDVEQRSEQWRAAGWTGFDANADAYMPDQITAERTTYNTTMDRDVEDDTTVQLMEEELHVGKRQVERGGVRVHTHVEETPVSEDVELREERVRIERRPVDRPVSAADVDVFQERTIEMTEMGEEVVAEKQARVTEEIVIGKDVDVHTETVRDTIRRTEVDIEGASGTFDNYDQSFRTDYDTNYATSGYSYDQYQPAYRYGYTLASDERYSNRNWAEIEPDIRRRWEGTNQGTWEDFKDAIRRGWEEVESAVR